MRMRVTDLYVIDERFRERVFVKGQLQVYSLLLSKRQS
jgi:hypothetical protein